MARPNSGMDCGSTRATLCSAAAILDRRLFPASLTEAALAQHILYLAEDIVAENDIQQIYNAEELSLEVV